jgi:hypothetical protein
MKACRQVPEIRAVLGDVSIDAIAAEHGFRRPTSLTSLVQQLCVAEFSATVTTPDPESLGGTVGLTVRGALRVAWVAGFEAWRGPAPIGSEGLFPPGAAVAASAQFGLSEQTDVFAIDNKGVLRVAWVAGAGSWHGPAEVALVLA